MDRRECRSGIESPGEIPVTGPVALQFARRRGVNENLPDIKRIKAITFSMHN